MQSFGNDFFVLNIGVLNITKKLIANEHKFTSISDHPIKKEKLISHVSWIYFIQSDTDVRILDTANVRSLMNSPIYVHMLSILYPDNLVMANYAINLYPEDVYTYYWLINASDPTLQNIPEDAVQKILSINPNDGLAWRYMGLILTREGDITSAIDAYINSCYNGDPGSNGCLNAGRLLEQEGHYEEAIYYYRLSRHDFIRANADRLEAELSSQNP